MLVCYPHCGRRSQGFSSCEASVAATPAKFYVMLECVSPQTRDVDLSQAGRGLEEALLGLGSAGNTQREDG